MEVLCESCVWEKVKHTLWGGQDCCHIWLFLVYSCLTFNHVIIEKDFHIFLHIMVPIKMQRNHMPNKLHLFISYDVMN
jgi:hypothetical protein